MDITAIFSALRDFADAALSRFTDITKTWNNYQWMLFIGGIALLVLSIIQTIRARRIFSYKVGTWGIKASFLMITLAFAWPYAEDLYNESIRLFGSPLAAMIVIIGGMFLGYNIVKILLARAREKVV